MILLLGVSVGFWPELSLGQTTGGGGGIRIVTPFQANPLPAAGLVTKPAEYRVQPGDQLNVSVFQEPELTQRVKVSSQGTINYPLLGSVQVGAMTVAEVEKLITDLLAKDYLVNPRVTISAETYKVRRVSILGQVKSPNSFEIPEQETLTLLEAIARAGGFTDTAQPDRVNIIRTENGKEQSIRVNATSIMKTGDRSKDVELKPGDIVSVPEKLDVIRRQ